MASPPRKSKTKKKEKTSAKATRKPRSKTRSTAPKHRKSRGGQPGNQNARKHGLWSSLFTDDEVIEIATYPDPSIDDILPLLLVRIGRAVDQGESLDSISRGVDTFLRALKTRHQISGAAAQAWAQALSQALDEVADELGLPEL